MVRKLLSVFFLFVCVTDVTSAVARLQVCEWARPDGRKLSCPEGEVVNIVTALYGRKSILICRHGNHKGVTTCGSDAQSLDKAERECNGMKECYLRASNNMFGDPCWGINKYLDVSYTCVQRKAMKKELLAPYVGKWSLEYSNSHKDTYTVSSDGKVTLSSSRRSVHLEPSDNQVDFPSSQGWYKVDKVFRAKAWEYIRLHTDGTMEVRHFCSDGCKGRYKHSSNYCCQGEGFQIAAEGRPTRTYNVAVKTSNKAYAGTDAKSYVVIYGEKGDTGKLFFKKSFWKNTVVNFVLQGMDVGEITMMKIGHDNSGSAAGWHVDTVVIKVASCSSTFSVWQWILTGKTEIDVYPTLEQGECPKSKDVKTYTTYDVALKTTNINYAGTDANSYIIIFGEKGSTGRLHFRRSFWRGTVVKFSFKALDVGKITHMKIGHDNAYSAAGWHVDSVVIKAGSCSSTFSIKKWIQTGSLEYDVKPVSQTGACATVVTGTLCRRDFLKIGCFSRDWSKVPDLIITDLDPTHKNYTTDMNWDNYAEGLHSLACRCRAKAKGVYKYFGIGFLGECVAGRNEKALEEMFKGRVNGGKEEKEGCVNGKWEECDKNHYAECAGNADFDFFYKIVE